MTSQLFEKVLIFTNCYSLTYYKGLFHSTVTVHQLNSALETALKFSSYDLDPYSDLLSFTPVDSSKELSSEISMFFKDNGTDPLQSALNELDSVLLNYRVTSPVNLIISELSLKKYNTVFRFLFKLKRVAYSLREVWIRMKISQIKEVGSLKLHVFR